MIDLYLQQADLLITSVFPTSQRLKIVDITLPWAYDHFAFLIPVNSEMANIDAVTKPFQWPVKYNFHLRIKNLKL